MANKKAARRERKSARFTQKHPELPKGSSSKFASRKEWSRLKKSIRREKSNKDKAI